MSDPVRIAEEKRLRGSRVVLYHSPYCGFSRRALDLLDRRGANPEVVVALGNQELRAWLRSVTGQVTLPQVFIDEKPVGGYSDLLELDFQGKLQLLLIGDKAS